MLSFAEEIYLLALDDITGKISSYSNEISLGYALIGAILCELSFVGKIDTDTEHLYLVDKTLTGNKALDSVLEIIAQSATDMPVSYWLKMLLSSAQETEELILTELINKGVLKKVDERIFWVFHTRRYPIVNNKEIVAVEERIKRLVLNDEEIPDPREAVLVSLIQACDLFDVILSPKEFRRAEKRIQNLAKLDMVGRSVNDMIKGIKNFSSLILNPPL